MVVDNILHLGKELKKDSIDFRVMLALVSCVREELTLFCWCQASVKRGVSIPFQIEAILCNR